MPSNLMHKFSARAVKIPGGLLCRNWQANSKTYVKMLKIYNSQSKFAKIEKSYRT